MNSRVKNILIWILPFWSLLVWITWWNRPAQDDFFFQYLAEEMGIIQGVWYQYSNWCTRYGGLAIGIPVAYLSKSPGVYGGFSLLLMCGLALEFGRWIQQIKRRFSIPAARNRTAGFLLCAGLFLATPEKGETWFWLASSCTYLLSVLCVFGMSRMALMKKPTTTSFLWIACYAAGLGSMNETLAFSALLGMTALLIWLAVKRKNSRFKLALWGTAWLLFAFLILLVAPGNALRASAFDPPGWQEWPLNNAKLSWWMLRNALAPYAIWILLGSLTGGITLYRHLPPLLSLTRTLALTAAIPIVVFCFQGMLTKLTGEPAAQRTFFPVVVSIWLILSLLIQRLLYCMPAISRTHAFGKVTVFGWWLLCIGLWSTQAALPFRYAAAWDSRMQLLGSDNYCTHSVPLRPLPESGWLYSAEISTDSSHFSVEHLRLALKLPCKPISQEANSAP